MPKLKTKKGLAKRVKVTGGRIKRARGFASHLLAKKSSSRKRRLRKGADVSPADRRNVKRMLPYA